MVRKKKDAEGKEVMRRIIVWQLAIVFILMIGYTTTPATWAAEPATKACYAKPSLLHLKVDFAAPTRKDSLKPIAGTTKKGWWPWVVPDWDFYRSDLT